MALEYMTTAESLSVSVFRIDTVTKLTALHGIFGQIVVEKYADKRFVPNQLAVPGQQEVYHGAGPISELKEMMLLHLGL